MKSASGHAAFPGAKYRSTGLRAFSSGTCSPVTGDTFMVSPSQRVTGLPCSSVTYSTPSYASTASRFSMFRKSRITGCGGFTLPRVRKCHWR